ncbi:Elongation of very long chain fatty acids protein 4 [Holothuria leucospilota]|uniref:Elongation of very long chain fatty acids protein n=1 Tax=Holothuria leucospilota TaxID=206669 RepID=A0A9Q1C9P4_HOLLE|nr:Elongation of very long chain fatty acids protein 4 [Holothuria leucospilota]
MATFAQRVTDFYDYMLEKGDPRVEDWFLMKNPLPIIAIEIFYLVGVVWLGPRIMANRQPFNLKGLMIVYNGFLVLLSMYMFYEFRISSWLANYSYRCQPVDYSNDPLALRMANVCWWYFFSKVIELLDTIIFVLRKKNNQISFLHVFHHSTMIINWWLGVKYIAGGQSWFLAMCNSFIHILMYSYYALAAIGPQMQKFLWWKRYMTQMQLIQFVLVVCHTGYNIYIDCNFPQGFNYAVFAYGIFLIILFSNFYIRSYFAKKEKQKE